MKKIIMLIVLLALFGSLSGCFWGPPPGHDRYDRYDRHNRYDRSDRHDRDDRDDQEDREDREDRHDRYWDREPYERR